MIPITDAMIQPIAEAHGVPWTLAAAICEVESSRNPWAMRFEPDYGYLFGGALTTTERIAQKTSYGCMQVMGAVARELGFRGAYLTELCDPQVALNYGCMHLANYYRKHGTWKRAIAAYNAGAPRINPDGTFRNQEYVNKVIAAGARIGWQE